ncbi:TonB-linked SusC/RagA family outer membrane protein [Lewinella marina]|uniref:SusC/RagA family TonB-linked outer membrane protein n=1 Tax=Neolewinella marina TaxID=438751 RepID=UPI00143000F3|nr:TonB-dependent receptor [Neolewinella marina]NJB85420.1 TonB-linked SusC/RagA family outer membrane protein [Neolewinella marina]
MAGGALSAQELEVSGIVTSSESGEPLIGVTVQIADTGQGTITGLDGDFELLAEMGDTLKLTYTGMQSREVVVDGPSLTVRMDEQVQNLEQVVVIGYGAVKKKEVTGAVSQVSGAELEEFVTPDIGTAIQGRVAGVNVTAASGAPGAAANIQIRGITSLDGSNAPLYVVDGIPQDGDPRLSPNEIETIDILKDAASAAIYGTRGSAGVILITTKTGQSGRMQINLDQSYGINTINDGVALMNTQEQLYFEQTVFENVAGSFEPLITQRPEWLQNDNDLREFVQVDNAATQNYSLDISGGNNELSYSLVGGYYDQEGTLINSSFKRYNGRASTRYRKNKLSVSGSLAFSTENTDETDGNLLLNGIRYQPYQPFFTSGQDILEVDGGAAEFALVRLATSLRRRSVQDRDRANASLNLRYDLTNDLSFVSNLGGSITNTRAKNFSPSFTTFDVGTGEFENDPTRSLVENISGRANTYLFDAGLNYTKRFGDHRLTALASFSVDERNFESFEAGRQGVSNNNISVINIGTINPFAHSGFGYTIKTVGTIGRVQYDYQGRYLFSASVRRDGSSKFAEVNRYGVFPSFSAAWNVADEKFWAGIAEKIDNFKIRASYGQTGNESFPAYRFSTVVEQEADYVFGNNIFFGSAQRNYANSLVQWETSIQRNLGVDIGFGQGKVLITADYYVTDKEDMLFPVQLPSSAGVLSGGNAQLTLNVGDMTNTGIEVTSRYRTRLGAVKMDLGLTFTRNINEITRINGETELIYNDNGVAVPGENNSQVTTLAVGREVGSYFLFRTNGVVNDQEELAAYREIEPTANLGDLIYVDVNGDGAITQQDREYRGSALPEFEAGFNTNFSFKGIDLSTQWYAAVGHEIINGSAAFAYSNGRHRDLVYQWSAANPESDIPLRRDRGNSHPNYAGNTDLWLEDGTFLRLRTVTLGYQLPPTVLARVGIERCRVYLSAQNPLTITDYTGADPEVGGNNVAIRGLDRGNYPVGAQYLFGTQISF